MCTLTHFAQPTAPYLQPPPAATARHSRGDTGTYQPMVAARFQVILAGNAFFHIKEISTGCVRGFRADHNEACALARSLESRT
jgi:hypothetical protein